MIEIASGVEINEQETENNKGNMWVLDQKLDQPMDEESGRLKNMYREKDLPEGNWYCSNCTCRICGDLVNALSIDARKCSQCEHKYHETCMNLTDEDRAASDAWFCGPNCQEGLHQTRMQLSLQKHLQKRWISLGNRVYLGNQHATAVR